MKVTVEITSQRLEAFLDYLFSDGAGQVADRLVLLSEDGLDLGSWCRAAVRDAIGAILIDPPIRAILIDSPTTPDSKE